MMNGKFTIFSILLTCLFFFNVGFAKSDEDIVGEAAAAKILGAAPLYPSTELQKYVNLVGSSIAKHVKSKYKWKFGIIKSDGVNAFATPGGYILFTDGLFKILENEDQLAFVLAHEMSHVLRQHHYNVIKTQRLTELAAKNLQAKTKDDTVAKLSQASGQIYARGLDKSAEYESDRFGVIFMTMAGYAPQASLEVLEILNQLKGNDPRAKLLFSTHPTPNQRFSLLLESGITDIPGADKEISQIRKKRFLKIKQLLK